MDKFDLRDAPKRRVQQAMEKENRKIREAAKQERNEIATIQQESLAGGSLQVDYIQAFGKRKFGELIDQPIDY